jgi:fructokinase
MPLYGAIEAGGTKFVCAIGDSPAALRSIRRISTSPTNPLTTMAEVVAYFNEHGPVDALGLACFGPLDIQGGRITKTPKLAWQHFAIREVLERAFRVPVGFDTDVNAAALGELRAGAAQGLHSFVYLTVGTGIGGGAFVDGRMIHGNSHPEMGHIPVAPALHEKPCFRGVCPFHHGCLEGMASGPSMLERWGVPSEDLPDGHPGWALEAHYLAQACLAFACTLSPQAILLGGGVMARAGLIDTLRTETTRLLSGYLDTPAIRTPALPYPGLSGALALAIDALH